MKSEENNIPKEELKKKWRFLLLDYFTDIIQYEQNLDSLRQSLSQQNNFSIENIFNSLDNEQKGYLTLGDFLKFLSDHSIPVEEKYIRQFIHFYDKNNDFVLNLEEFSQVISDKKINGSKKEENNENKQEIDDKIISIFCDILIQEIELCKRCEENSRKCFESKHFTIYEAFIEITEDEGYVTMENLMKFFDENGVKSDENYIQGIIKRLDKDNDGKISYVEFHDMFFLPSVEENKKFNEYKFKLDDFKNSNINNKSYNPQKKPEQPNQPEKSEPKNINKDYYNEKNIDKTDIKSLDFKYGFSANPRIKYTSSVLNYNYSKCPDLEYNKYKLDKEYNSLKNSKESKGKEISKNLETPSNQTVIHCHCCNCYCHICCK